jgi:PAS domain S-box-containing protein
MFGWTPAEAVGRHITLIIPDERRAEEDEVLARLRRGERIDHFETVRITKDRRLVDVSITVSPIRDVQGRIVGASKIARDITDRRRAERTLAATVQRLEVLYRLADGIARARNPLGVYESPSTRSWRRARRGRAVSFDDAGVMRCAWRRSRRATGRTLPVGAG